MFAAANTCRLAAAELSLPALGCAFFAANSFLFRGLCVSRPTAFTPTRRRRKPISMPMPVTSESAAVGSGVGVAEYCRSRLLPSFTTLKVPGALLAKPVASTVKSVGSKVPVMPLSVVMMPSQVWLLLGSHAPRRPALFPAVRVLNCSVNGFAEVSELRSSAPLVTEI